MITRRLKIRRHLRSVRVSALTEEERRREMREASDRDPPEHAGAGVPLPPLPEAGLRLACEVCGVEFLVTVSAYGARRGIVACPRCGSTDLVVLDPGDDVGLRPETDPS